MRRRNGATAQPKIREARAARGIQRSRQAAPIASALDQQRPSDSNTIRGVQRHDFAYDLPPELIAQTPLAERSASRLLVVEPSDEAADILSGGDLAPAPNA